MVGPADEHCSIVVGLPKELKVGFDPVYERQELIVTESVALCYYPELGIVHHQMLQMPDSATFRLLLTRGAEAVERHQAGKWLSDDRGNTFVRDVDAKWASTVWLPRVQAGGFRYWAIVLPEAAVGKLNMRRLTAEHARRGITSRIENTPEAAFRWLKAQPAGAANSATAGSPQKKR